jgi:hypothetical protein
VSLCANLFLLVGKLVNHFIAFYKKDSVPDTIIALRFPQDIPPGFVIWSILVLHDGETFCVTAVLDMSSSIGERLSDQSRVLWSLQADEGHAFDSKHWYGSLELCRLARA